MTLNIYSYLRLFWCHTIIIILSTIIIKLHNRLSIFCAINILTIDSSSPKSPMLSFSKNKTCKSSPRPRLYSLFMHSSISTRCTYSKRKILHITHIYARRNVFNITGIFYWKSSIFCAQWIIQSEVRPWDILILARWILNGFFRSFLQENKCVCVIELIYLNY